MPLDRSDAGRPANPDPFPDKALADRRSLREQVGGRELFAGGTALTPPVVVDRPQSGERAVSSACRHRLR
ncbi:MAG: Uncharacterised protein [Prochlorococcus marinus str. MIT 9313]|nr:MAG: Uncharacterised protein [Prochlorococcus marinus str. MIT 9313]